MATGSRCDFINVFRCGSGPAVSRPPDRRVMDVMEGHGGLTCDDMCCHVLALADQELLAWSSALWLRPCL